MTHAQAGRITTLQELDALGLLAPSEPPKPAPARSTAGRGGRWPSYAKCLSNAPMTTGQGDRPDISRADFTFAVIAIDWGNSPEETAARLMQVSDKARENGPSYAEMTARNAAAAVAERAQRSNGP